MFVRLGNLVLVIALFAALGAHWAVLQSVAWTSMLADNLSSDSFSEAFGQNFRWQAPLCLSARLLRRRKRVKRRAGFPNQFKRMEFTVERDAFVFAAPRDFSVLFAEAAVLAGQLRHTPPTPPPRAA